METIAVEKCGFIKIMEELIRATSKFKIKEITLPYDSDFRVEFQQYLDTLTPVKANIHDAGCAPKTAEQRFCAVIYKTKFIFV